MAIHGTVTRIEAALGFGFVRDDSDGDWTFVVSREPGRREVAVGQRVTFDQEWTPQGPRATNLRAESEAS